MRTLMFALYCIYSVVSQSPGPHQVFDAWAEKPDESVKFLQQDFENSPSVQDDHGEGGKNYIKGEYTVEFDSLTGDDEGTTITNVKAHAVPFVDCKKYMRITLPSGPLCEIKVLGSNDMQTVVDAPQSCGYSLSEEHGLNILHVSFSGCHVTVGDGNYTLRVQYVTYDGKQAAANLSCASSPSSIDIESINLPQPDQSVLQPSPTFSFRHLPVLPPALKLSGCGIPPSMRLPCGNETMSSAECKRSGCCVDPETTKCFRPMDECTADGQFVFAIHGNLTSVPLDPTRWVVVGDNDCKPAIANNDFAVFMFSVDACGTHMVEIGETVMYLAEVQNVPSALHLKHGVITRVNPVRVMVECRYSNSSDMFVSTGYIVMSPSLPPSITSEGLFGVQLRIAEDGTFTKFFSHDHLPLHLLLGRPVYLEIILRSPKPLATLLINYCVAYPRSARNALILIYEGCPNPYDPDGTSILYTKGLPQSPYQRHFVVKAFEFMDVLSNKYLNEEIYFMCSTEVCMPSRWPCKETCLASSSQASGD